MQSALRFFTEVLTFMIFTFYSALTTATANAPAYFFIYIGMIFFL